jgi:phage terminase large subunit-like protein
MTMHSTLQSLPFETLSALEARLAAEQSRRQRTNLLRTYRPYPKQIEFHAAGAKYRERLLMASNRFGKSICGAAETAIHLTGEYPDWWTGKRFDKPIKAWAAGVTSETTRDIVQDKLIGPPNQKEDWGTGFIPKRCLGECVTGRGVANAIDTISIRHISGGWSTLQFKSYERGREKWQGTALEVIWMDEECDMDIYTEALTRTNETGGIVYVTFTPLKGYSDVVARFMGMT